MILGFSRALYAEVVTSGYIVESLDVLTVDLLAPIPHADSPDMFVVSLARLKFDEQNVGEG